jgi:hypothetical protein
VKHSRFKSSREPEHEPSQDTSWRKEEASLPRRGQGPDGGRLAKQGEEEEDRDEKAAREASLVLFEGAPLRADRRLVLAAEANWWLFVGWERR